jgi:tetratricopeptide (TPR) repeat protein
MEIRRTQGLIVKVFTLIAGFAALLIAATPQFDEATQLYQHTNFERSLKELAGLPQNDPAVQHLIGRNQYMLGEFKKASEAFEKAFAADPGNSDYAMWLGRAYGRRAETSSPFTAPGYASKTHQYFERAVALNPRNLEAMNDLLEYYLEAPGFLGGGFDKASALVVKIGQADPVEGTWAQAKLAEKKKEFRTAEERLRQAAQLAPQQIGRVIDLARFLSRQGRYEEAEQSFQKAEKIAPNSPKLMYERAEAYIEAKRNLPTAKTLLQKYLSSPLTADDPPRSDAEKLLRKVQGG